MRILVVGWAADELERAAFEQVVVTARAVGHAVAEVDLCRSGFRAAMPAAERAAYHEEPFVPSPDVADHVALVRDAEVMVFVFPSTASSIPPVLRGWLERVMVPGVAFVFDEAGRVRPGLRHVRRIVGVATYPVPWWRVKLDHDNGRRVLLRALRLNTGFSTRTDWIACYDAGRSGRLGRSGFLARIERRMATL